MTNARRGKYSMTHISSDVGSFIRERMTLTGYIFCTRYNLLVVRKFMNSSDRHQRLLTFFYFSHVMESSSVDRWEFPLTKPGFLHRNNVTQSVIRNKSHYPLLQNVFCETNKEIIAKALLTWDHVLLMNHSIFH